MKNIIIKKTLGIGLLLISVFAQAGEGYTYFEFDNTIGYKLSHDTAMHRVFLQSPFLRALSDFGGTGGDGTEAHPFMINEVEYANFDTFIQWIDGDVTLEDFDFYGLVALAQIIDYFDLINISIDTFGLSNEEKDLSHQAHERLNKLILDLGKRLKMHRDEIALLTTEEYLGTPLHREYLQIVCNNIIAYYQESSLIDYDKIYFFSKEYPFNNYLSKFYQRGVSDFIKNNLNIKLGSDRFAIFNKLIRNIDQNFLSNLRSNEYLFAIQSDRYGIYAMDNINNYYVILKIVKKDGIDTLPEEQKVMILENLYTNMTPYEYIFIGFLNKETGEITRFFDFE